jgi:hypothetical protein
MRYSFTDIQKPDFSRNQAFKFVTFKNPKLPPHRRVKGIEKGDRSKFGEGQ